MFPLTLRRSHPLRAAPRLELPARAGSPGDPVEVQFLGAAGFAISSGAHVLLVDPYVTRVSLARCLVLAPLVPDEGAIARLTPRADAIVVGHTHFDHALDVPAIALRTGARVFGSRSAALLVRGAGVDAAKVVDVETRLAAGAFEAEVGPFHLRFFPSAHSKLLFGRVPLAGDIDDCDAVPLRIHEYKCGAVFSIEVQVGGRRIVHLGSAETVEAAVPADARGADLLLLCAAGWTKGANVPERVVRAWDPGAILLSHWDDFLRAADDGGRLLPGIRLPGLIERLHAAARGTPVGIVPVNEALSI